MRLIADTNAVIAAMIKNSTSRKILLNQKFEFSVPDFSFGEINKYEKEICKKAGVNEDSFDLLISIVFEKINVVPFSEYIESMAEAERLIGRIDIKDVPFVACALSLKTDGIWTEDKGFLKQNKVKVWRTNDLMKFI